MFLAGFCPRKLTINNGIVIFDTKANKICIVIIDREELFSNSLFTEIFIGHIYSSTNLFPHFRPDGPSANWQNQTQNFVSEVKVLRATNTLLLIVILTPPIIKNVKT